MLHGGVTTDESLDLSSRIQIEHKNIAVRQTDIFFYRHTLYKLVLSARC